MISKGKRRFLVRLNLLTVLCAQHRKDGQIDLFGWAKLAALKPRLRYRTTTPRKPWVMPTLATPETHAKLREIQNNIMARYRSNVENIQG
jgi:hypothetical protein